MVPKGFIRYQVLEALSQKPMSGSEIMDEIAKHTGGFWKPSPGSIYPLLAWLQDNNYIKELPLENGLKRYELTPNGKALLEEQKNIMKRFRETMGFAQPPFSAFFMKVTPEKEAVIRDTMRRAGIAMFQLSNALQKNFSEEAFNEGIKAINEAATKLEEIARKLKGEQE
ncbi:MAG: PadR family transcriptional regulator [Candidatus Bathyarchaeota archaeon]|nr:PadR family transcriptional regulator [Candidatus Bathyarchaeota archaeon]